jgi:hypothetical protein
VSGYEEQLALFTETQLQGSVICAGAAPASHSHPTSPELGEQRKLRCFLTFDYVSGKKESPEVDSSGLLPAPMLDQWYREGH